MADVDPNIDNPAAPGDGLPDGLEDTVGGLKDPDGRQLPNLKGMGAGSDHRDLFVEFNAAWAPAGTSYGSATHPYSSTITTKTDPDGHHHVPTPEMLRMIGDRLVQHGITPHFDLGDIDAYHDLGVITHSDWVDDYTVPVGPGQTDGYLVPSNLARGGELIEEQACNPDSPNCQFPAFPGTFGWRLGFELLRDAQVGDNGEELTVGQLGNPADPDYYNWADPEHDQRRRYDVDRHGLFHYMLFGHFRGKPRSSFPCLANGNPATPGPYDANSNTACGTQNPDFHIPSGVSGIADLPGDGAMVTMGRFDEFVGRPFARASTAFHELGHNLNLWHGGLPATWGNRATNAQTIIEPQCKPNHQSSISYMFQLHGLFGDDDVIKLDFSGKTHTPPLNETGTMSDGSLSPAPNYRSAWYAPLPSLLATQLGITEAVTRYCTGVKPETPPSMARVQSLTVAAPIDWNGDLDHEQANAQQDVNFDGVENVALPGYNDWANLRLNQRSLARNLRLYDAPGGTGNLVMDIGSGSPGLFGDIGSGGSLFSDFGSGIGPFQDAGSGSGPWGDFAEGFTIVQDFGEGDDPYFDDGEGSNPFLDFAEGISPWIDAAEGSGPFADAGSGQKDMTPDDGFEIGGPSAPHGLDICIVSGSNCLPNEHPALAIPALKNRNVLKFKASTFLHVVAYHVQRKRTSQPATEYDYVDVVSFDSSGELVSGSTTNEIFDPEELPNGVSFTYRVQAEFDEPKQQLTDPNRFSGWSVPETIVAVNVAPMAAGDSGPAYTTVVNTLLTVAAPGVLGNDDRRRQPVGIHRPYSRGRQQRAAWHADAHRQRRLHV